MSDEALARDDVDRSAARIRAELAGSQSGTNPFAAAVQATRMPMAISNPREPDNPIVFVNDAFCSLTGYSRAEVLGRNCRFLQGPGTDPATIARIKAAIHAVEPIEVELRNYRKNGEPFWNRLLLAPVHDPDGSLAYYFANQADITTDRQQRSSLEHKNRALMAEVVSRMQAQEAQQASEARLRFATEAGRLGIWELDLQTNELTVSAVFKDSFGRDRHRPFTFDELQAATHPDDLDRMQAALRHSIATGSDYDIEYRVMRPGGDIGWVHVRAQVVRGAGGAAARMAGILLDVTSRRCAELRLEDSEQSLRLATEAAGVGTWTLDVVTSEVTCSDRNRANLGLAPGATFGLAPGGTLGLAEVYAGVHPDDREGVRAALASATDPGTRASYEIEFRAIGYGGDAFRWVLASGKGVFEGERCLRVLGTSIDITARKLVSNRQTFLLKLMDRLRTLTDPWAIMDAAVQALGRHLGASRVGYGHVQADDATIVLEQGYADGVEPLFGALPLASFGARYVARLRRGLTVVSGDVAAGFATDPGPWTAPDIGAFVSVPLIRNHDLRANLYVTYRNPCVWAPEDVALIEDVAGRTWEAVERARAEAGLRQTNEVLEARVADRTRDLVQANDRLRAEALERGQVEEALRQAQKMEAVGQLTGGIAHDFNNMLQSVGGSLEMMRRRLGQGRIADADRLGDAAAEGLGRAAALTHRLLAFARRQALEPRSVEPDELIQGMAELIRRSVGPGISVKLAQSVHGSAGTWTVLCDANQLESALLNLAINARDAMPEGGQLSATTANVRLRPADIAATDGASPGDYVEIAVADTGTGMSPDVMARAFEPFFTTKPIGQGTGLGLSQLYGFVHQSNGFVRLDSVPGQGTTVRIYLPRHDADAESAGDAEPQAGVHQAEAGRTVLVVEDEPAVRMLICETLRDLGHQVLEAEDGPAGLRIVERPEHLDLLVTDVGLPGLNGRQLADAAQQRRPGLPVLLITGYAGPALAGWTLAPGMGVIGKPFTLDCLAERIVAMLDMTTDTA